MLFTKKLSPVALSLSLGFVLAACGDDESPTPGTTTPPTTQSNSIVDVANEAGIFTTLVGALEATGLDATLSGPGPFTVFAPTDEAFARLPDGVIASLDNETLVKILTYHVVAAEAPASMVVGMDSATTVEGSDVAISMRNGNVFIDGVVMVTATDIMADNGVIHVIDSVMLPGDIDFPGTIVDAAIAYPAFDTLVGAVVAADLAGTLTSDNMGDGFTVFAPTNQAFIDLGVDLSMVPTGDLANILLYHVVPATVDSSAVVGISSAPTAQGDDISVSVDSDGVVLNGESRVTWVDIRTTNGIIHVIDTVLVPSP